MELLYSENDTAEEAFLLRSGRIIMEVGGEKIPVSGNNLIIGCVEVILNFDSFVPQFRFCNVYLEEDVDYQKIAANNLEKLIPKYNIGFNVNAFLSQVLLKTNEVELKLKKKVEDDEKAEHRNAVAYFTLVEDFTEIAQNFNFPEYLELAKTAKEEIIYQTGKILSRQETTQYQVAEGSDHEVFSPGQKICNQGEDGNELYILKEGVLEVVIGEQSVAEVKEPGTIIGEVALFLGEKRSATLIAKTEVKIAIVSKSNLESFIEGNLEFFKTVAVSLAKKIRKNFIIIKNLMAKIKNSENISDLLKKEPGLDKLVELSTKILEIWNSKKEPENLKGFMDVHGEDLQNWLEKAQP